MPFELQPHFLEMTKNMGIGRGLYHGKHDLIQKVLTKGSKMIVKEKWQRPEEGEKREFRIIPLHDMKDDSAFSVTWIIAKNKCANFLPQWEK